MDNLELQDALIEDLAKYSADPYGFVLWAFPWGEPGELENEQIEEWQARLLIQVRDGLLTPNEAILTARTSGHGIGKSALVAWLILWALSTFPDTVGVVTANTETQLKTKTWVQVAKWYRMFIGRALFDMTATAIFSVDPEHARTWRLDMVPWSERNTEAFAGLHNQGKRIIIIFDEASAIPDLIFEVTEGALTDKDTQILWFLFGNPTKNSGRFRECFAGGKFAHRWKTEAIDSRSVRITNKEQFERWIKDYGEDSDFVRVRIKGMFPRVDALSFISMEVARAAVNREIELQYGHNVVIGVDVGRFGDDPSIIYPRKGRDARSLPIEVFYGVDTMRLAAYVAASFLRHNASVVMVDSGGVGGGVVDRLRQLQIPVMDVDFGSAAAGTNEIERGVRYANKRAEIWGALRDWLPTGAIYDNVPGTDISLIAELTAPNYGLNAKEALLLESKKDMRSRGVPSPNVADALACTFAFPFMMAQTINIGDAPRPAIVPEYNPFSVENIYGA